MRKLFIAVLVLMILGSAAAYVVFRLTRKPPPTPRAWHAQVITVAGDGSPTPFSDPFGVAVTEDGTVYVSDAGNSNRIRKIAPDGSVTTLAGGNEGFADGAAAQASFNTPSGLAVDHEGNIYVADTGNNRIRKVTPAGLVSTIAGDGASEYADGPAAQARFNGPIGVAVDASGNVYVADTYNDRIRKISIDGQVTTVAGAEGPGYADGAAQTAQFDTPCGIVVAGDGSLIVADTGNHRLRKITPQGAVSTLPSNNLELSSPIGLALTHDGFLYVTEFNRSRVVQITPEGDTHVIASGEFNQPAAVAIRSLSELYVADSGNYVVRKLSATDQATAETGQLPHLTKETLGQQSLLWPLDPQQSPHEVVATVGEVRGSFDSTDSRDHLHSGLDVFGAYGDVVRAVRDEKVTGPFPNWGLDSLNEGLRVGVVSYIHMHVGRDKDGKMFDDARFIPIKQEDRLTRLRIKRGTRFKIGEAIGTVNRMYHVHMNIGPPGGEINPLTLSPIGFADDKAPTIESVQLFDSSGAQFKDKQSERLLITGNVRIVVDAYDRTNMNPARRRLGLYKLGYQVLKPDGSAATGFDQPRITIVFDRLPPDDEATKIAYAEESGITVYGSAKTRFLYEITNTVREGRAERGVWDTSQLPKGDYVLRIVAADYSGNEAQQGRDLNIRIR